MALNKQHLAILVLTAVCLITALVFTFRSSFSPAIHSIVPDRPLTQPEGANYEWTTHTDFRFVSEHDALNLSVEELCESFPKHLLRDIQPVLKTGSQVVAERLPSQFQTVSACLENLLIFSDLDQEFENHTLSDVLAEIPRDLLDHEQLRSYRQISAHGKHVSGEDGWKLDKFKFLAGISAAWRRSPEKRWYVFFEGDTFVMWDNLFRLLQGFDPDAPLYFGSPTPGRDETWFANGGPGYVISREAMRRLTEHDWDHETGEYRGSQLSAMQWDELLKNCCGDSQLGWALWEVGVSLGGLWPMFNPHPPHGNPFADRYWCQPIITMHKPWVQDMEKLWRWEWKQRQSDRPLLYRDLALDYYNFTNLTRRHHWDNSLWDGFDSLVEESHQSADYCEAACRMHDDCFQWTYKDRKCVFVRSIRYGDPAKEGQVSEAGWIGRKIEEWANERLCEEPAWVRTSTTRIF